jgi:hypothetical protein
MIPAIRATAMTSPFVVTPDRIASSVSGFIRITPRALAMRSVIGFPVMSTIRARPVESKWVMKQ